MGIRCSTSTAADNNDDAPCYDEHAKRTNNSIRGKEQWELEWNVRYEELKDYIAEHGNALVPHIFPQNQSL
jgi:hypothetical protein